MPCYLGACSQKLDSSLKAESLEFRAHGGGRELAPQLHPHFARSPQATVIHEHVLVAKADYEGAAIGSEKSGESSLHKRADQSRLARGCAVRTVRLDDLLAAESLVDRPVAL